MKFAGYLLALSAVTRGGLGLTVSLSEPGAEFSDDILLNDSPRSISLVPGRTYSISCEGTEWHRNGQLVTATTPVIDGVSGVYVVSNGDATILMLQLFSESLVGQYFCRDDAGAEFIINISTGNPVLVLGQEVIGLKKDVLRQSLPFFSVFGSGDPQPQPSDYSWYFNGDLIFVNGAVDSSVIDINTVFERVTNNRITLKQRIDYSVEGTYMSVVNTMAGQTSVLIKVDVQAEPDPDILVVQKYSLATGRSIVFNCSDSVADPIPSFSWSINSLHQLGSAVVVFSSGNIGRESYLTITEVDLPLNGIEVTCNSSNVVENEPIFKVATEILTVQNCQNMCHHNATCTVFADGFNCSCNSGFSGDGVSCQEISECEHAASCHQNATCTAVVGGFNCVCNPGFSGDGFSCQEIKYQTTPTCSDLVESYDYTDSSDAVYYLVGIITSSVIICLLLASTVLAVICIWKRRKQDSKPERATAYGTHITDEGGAYTLGVMFSASTEPSTTTFEASEDFYEQIRV